MKKYFIILMFFYGVVSFAQSKDGFQIARLKYNGGGDWYNDPSAEVNLLNFIAEHTNIKVKPEYTFVDVSSNDIFKYPLLYLTGHGTINFSEADAKRLRKYLKAGGFLYADDDYGMDKSFRHEIKKVFPNKKLTELPFSYGMYHDFYNFNYGVPKIQRHNGKRPQGFGIFVGKRLVVYYTYESDPGDGWADADVHGDSPQKREEALKFGTNLIIWVLSQ